MNKEASIKKDIEIFYSPYDDIEESIKMLEDIDLSLIDEDIKKPLKDYLYNTTLELNEKDKENKIWIKLASNICDKIS